MRNMHIKAALGALLISTLLGACAQPVALKYDHAEARLDEGSPYVLVIDPVDDMRGGGREIDKALIEPPVVSLGLILAEEMENTGVFADVLCSTETEGMAALLADPDRTQLRMKASLVDLAWHVPGYRSIQSTRSVSGMFGVVGVLASAAYETETDVSVYGRATIAVELRNADTDQVLLSKEYYGVVQERTKVADCDKNETKSHIVAESIEKAMHDIKADIGAVLKAG